MAEKESFSSTLSWQILQKDPEHLQIIPDYRFKPIEQGPTQAEKIMLPTVHYLRERGVSELEAHGFFLQGVYEMFYLEKGKLLLSTENQTVLMRNGEWLLLKPGTAYHIHCREDCQQKSLFFSFPESAYARKSSSYYSRDWGQFFSKNHFFLQQDLSTQVPVNRIFLSLHKRRAIELFSHFNKVILQNKKRLKFPSHNEKALVWRCRQVLENHLSSSTYLENLFNNLGYHPNYLRKLFKKHMHLRPGEYWLKLKMERAGSMLKGKVTSIQAVASACGYESLSHFSRVFRRYHGLSPRKYRQSSNTVLSKKRENPKTKT